ncbi:MAG: 50S ribosome-binding GTPase [Fretibacterium sp.]|nr:50S ribosome-binding GTPase [Fretibacterium sp.]
MGRTVWYPGHMARGGRKLAELLEKLDLIVEVRDARAPFSTSAPLVSSFARAKPVMLVLAKKDLADPERTRIWIRELERGREVWALDLRKERPTGLRKALSARKPGHRELRMAVMGIPNVGKSMLLNALVGKAQARVGGIPGLTREVSWYRSGDLLIVDSPGILDPHAEPGVHRMLSWLGCAKAEVLGGFEAAALDFIRFLRARGLFGSLLKKWEIEERDEPEEWTLERLGRRLGCLVAGGAVDRELSGRRLLDAFSSGKLGAVTLELPGDPLWGDTSPSS